MLGRVWAENSTLNLADLTKMALEQMQARLIDI
jgi:hypothetical protein